MDFVVASSYGCVVVLGSNSCPSTDLAPPLTSPLFFFPLSSYPYLLTLCVYVGVCACVCMRTHFACNGQRLTLVFFPVALYHIFWDYPWAYSMPVGLDWLVSSPRDSFVSASPALWYCYTWLSRLRWGLNSGHLVCPASSSLTEPSS